MRPRGSPTRISSSPARSRKPCSGAPLPEPRSKGRPTRISVSPISNTIPSDAAILTDAPFTCPFCGIACGDLTAGDMKGCAKAAAGFGAPLLSAEARIGGNAVPRAAAVREAARLLREARLPLISGLAVDLDGIRALLSLADRAGAVIDPWQSRRTQVNLEVMRRSGTITTTLGEIANRADLVALLGRDPSTDY